jgi:hypothetical protein
MEFHPFAHHQCTTFNATNPEAAITVAATATNVIQKLGLQHFMRATEGHLRWPLL